MPRMPATDRITATISTDDGLDKSTFNAVEWFRRATDEDILVLAEDNWRDCDHADEIAWVCADQTGVDRILDSLHCRPRRHPGEHREFVGFNVCVKAREAMLWLRDNRYEVWWEIYSAERSPQAPDPKPERPAPVAPVATTAAG